MEINEHKGLSRFRQFVDYHSIQPSTLWGTQTEIEPHQLIGRIRNELGYQMDVHEREIVAGPATLHPRPLKIEDFHQHGIWNRQETCQDLYLERVNRKHSGQIAKSFSRNQAPKQQRPRTAKTNNQRSRLSTSKLTRHGSNASCENLISASLSGIFPSCRYRKSRQCLHEKNLQSQVVENSLDRKWEYLIKVGEMNSWISSAQNTGSKSLADPRKSLLQDVGSAGQSLINGLDNETCSPGSPPDKLYRIENQVNDFRIVCCNWEGEQETVPSKVFDQRYQAERKKHVPMENRKNNMKGTIMMVLDSKEKLTKANLNDKVGQRDQEFNYILLEIMRMKSVFEQQQQVLRECQINL